MSTPPYFPPSIGPAGLTVSAYPSILADNLQAFLNIYGTNQVVTPDSAIYQLLSIISLKQSDTNLAAQLAYNQSSPQTAVGAGLDRQVKMNGLARAAFSFSTALLTVTGDPLVIISNGFAQDQNGNLWALPSTVTILNSGTISVLAVCTTPGAIAAEPGTINIINTPQVGWTGVTNGAAATPGAAVESDSELRARQSISVALPSTTPLASTIAAVLASVGVIRVAPGFPTPGGPGSSIENPTGATDSWGNPPHSISIVAECTNTLTVATAIYNKKTIGCFTNGTTTVPVVDPVTGVTEDISFFLPTKLPIFILLTVAGYGNTPTSATLSSVQTALVTYLNELAIGETVSIGALFAEAMAVNATLVTPSFGVQSVRVGTATASTTATFALAATTMTVASATGIVSGQLVTGAGIAPGTTVAGAPTGLSVPLSAPTTAAGSAVPVVVSTLSMADIAMPNFFFAAQGSVPNVNVLVT
jgi:Baseplate J-like protein